MKTLRNPLSRTAKNAVFTLLACITTLFSLPPADAQQASPAFSSSLSPGTIGPGSTATLTFQIDNSNSSQPVTDLAFTATLPAGVTIATPSGATTNCTGVDLSLSAPDGGSTITFSGGRIGAGKTCSVKVNVTGATPGAHDLTSGDLTSSAGNSGPASATLTVATDRPGFSKSFATSFLAIGKRTTLTFTFDNSLNNATASNLTFTDVLPTGLEVAGPANAVTDCTGGVITAVPGSNTISYGSTFTGDASVAAGAVCTLSVDVVSTAVGTLNNVTGDLTTFNGGTTRSSGKATAALTVTPPPVMLFTKSFINDPVSPGGTATLRFKIQNLSRTDSATNIAFTDDLDATLSGLIAVGPLPSDPCGSGSTLTGASTLSLSGGTLAPEASCTFQVTVQVPTGAAPGQYFNTTSDLTAEIRGGGVTVDPATDSLFVTDAPVLTKTFLDNPVVTGGSTRLEFTITNVSSTQAVTDIAFVDELTTFLPFPASVTLPDTPCGPSSSLTLVSLGTKRQGLQLTGGELAAGASCTFEVTIDIPLDIGPGTATNTTGPISATLASQTVTGSSASANLEIVGGVNLSKEFIDDPVAPGDTTTLQFTLTLDEDAPAAATNIAFTDDLGAVIAGMASTSGAQTDICGAGSQISGTSTLSFSGGTLSPGESCSFSVQVAVPAATASGSYPNATSNVMATISGLETQGEPGTDNLIVTGLIFTKEFIDDPVIPGGTATLRFSIDNTNGDADVTNIQFSDDLDNVLDGLVAVAPLPDEPCGTGSQIVATSGNTFLQFVGGSLAAGEVCDFDVTVQIPANAESDGYPNVTSELSATIGGNAIALPGAFDELQVTGNLLALSKAFTDDPAAPGGSATLEFTLTNLDTVNAATGITFTDDLDAVIPGLASTSGTQLDVCGAGSELSGTGVLTLTAGSLGPGESCTFSAQVLVPANAEAGSFPNTTSSVSGTINGSAVTGNPATDNLDVGLITFTKRFASGDSALPGDVVTVEFTIANNSGNAVTDIGFTDDLNLFVSGAAAVGTPLSDVCGSGSTLSGTSIIALANASLLPGGSCTFSVDVQIPANASLGVRTNRTSDLVVSGLPAAPPAAADLFVDGAGNTPENALTVVVDPVTGRAWVNGVLRPGDIDYYTFTLAAGAVVQISSSGGLDTVGKLFDDAWNLLNDPVADGSAGGAGNFQSTLTLGPGTYFVEVTGNAPLNDGPYMFHLDQSGVGFRPDLLIGETLTDLKGNNIYNKNALGQKVRVTGSAAKNVTHKFFWAVENDGVADDNIRLKFRPKIKTKHKKWKLQIFQLTGGPTNVTGDFMSGSGKVNVDLTPAERITYRAEFTLKKGGKKVRKSFRVQAKSNLDTEKQDAIGALFILTP